VLRPSIPLVVLALGAVGCDRTNAPGLAVAPSRTVGGAPADPSQAYPSKEEVLDYLDGKTISRTQPPSKDEPQFILRQAQIEALEVSQSGTSVNDGPWTTAVTCIAKTDEGRFAVKLTVQHRRVENKRAFFGFQVSEIAKQ
jgi:hypothetical protein